jgi:octaprenyl-diphosphate synthase
MPSTVKINDLSQILAPIALDFKALDEVIRLKLASKVALIDQISTYIIQAGGKRVRPALLMLVAKALAHGKTTPHTLEMSAVVEFIHTATLLHDDVVDESTLRRGRETANAAFGNAASVLVGDFLYSRAFQMMVGPNDLRVM